MPQLPRSEWYDLTRDMNWNFSYVTDEQVFPEEMSESYGVPKEAWWTWDEPYKITYPEYVHVQAGKDASVYAVNSVVNRSKLYEGLDPGWKSAIMAHYGVTNTRMVMHLPLIVPEQCALNIVDGEAHSWREGELMMFDDTFQHEAWNRSDEPRLILLMDCWNPYLTEPEKIAVKQLVEAIDGLEN